MSDDLKAEAIARLAAKYESLRKSCAWCGGEGTLWIGHTTEFVGWRQEQCIECAGLGYLPRTGSTLLAGLVEVVPVVGEVNIEFDHHSDTWAVRLDPHNIDNRKRGGFRGFNNKLEAALVLALDAATGGT